MSSGSAEAGRGTRSIAAMVAVAVAAMFLLCGYELVRSASSSLYTQAYTAARLPVAMAITPVAVLLSIYGYGVLLSRFGPRRALLISTLLSGGLMVACYFGIVAGWKPASGALYLLREAYIVLVLEQYWSLINSTLSPTAARRFNGPITGIGSLGSILGTQILQRYVQQFGTEACVLLAAASLVPAGLCAWAAYALAGEPQASPEEAGGRQGHLAVGLFGRSPELLLLAVLIATTQVISAVLELRFNVLAEAAFPLKDARTAYFGWFWGVLNMVAAGLQFVVAPLLLRWVSLRAVHTGIPLIHLAMGAALLLHPSLRTGAAAYLMFKVLDYSVFRAGKEILYIPFSFDVRYRAKEVIDAFVYRFSKGGLGLLLALSGAFATLPGGIHASIAIGASLLWLPIARRLTRVGAKAG